MHLRKFFSTQRLNDFFRRPGSPALVSSLEKAVSFAADLVELKGLKPFLQSAAYRLFLKREKSLWIPSDASVPFDVREIEMQYRRVREGETHLTEFVFDVRAKVDAMRRSAQALRSLSDKFASFLFALEPCSFFFIIPSRPRGALSAGQELEEDGSGREGSGDVGSRNGRCS